MSWDSHGWAVRSPEASPWVSGALRRGLPPHGTQTSRCETPKPLAETPCRQVGGSPAEPPAASLVSALSGMPSRPAFR